MATTMPMTRVVSFGILHDAKSDDGLECILEFE